MRILWVLITHGLMLACGFAAGIYALPILTAPQAPSAELMQAHSRGAVYAGVFRRELMGSDVLHWGEGKVTLAPDSIALEGRLAPGPDYKLYLSPVFVESASAFELVKERAVRVGDVATFNNFLVEVPDGIDIDGYTTVVIWCEAFGRFISAARYR